VGVHLLPKIILPMQYWEWEKIVFEDTALEEQSFSLKLGTE